MSPNLLHFFLLTSWVCAYLQLLEPFYLHTFTSERLVFHATSAQLCHATYTSSYALTAWTRLTSSQTTSQVKLVFEAIQGEPIIEVFENSYESLLVNVVYT